VIFTSDNGGLSRVTNNGPLREDPYETRNVATDRPKKTTHLTNALKAWLKRTGAKLPTPNPDFNEKRWWASGREK